MKNVNRQLKELKKMSKPDSKFKKELWSKLAAEQKALSPTPRFSFMRMASIPLAAVVVFVSMGVGTYAYASPEVSEGHILQPIKNGFEQIEGFIPRSENGRAQFHEKMLRRRLEEADRLKRRDHIPIEHLQRISNQIQLTTDQVDHVKENPALRKRLELYRGEYREILRDRIEHRRPTDNGRLEMLRDMHLSPAQIEQLRLLRNEIDQARVGIVESDLSEMEKRALHDELREDIREAGLDLMHQGDIRLMPEIREIEPSR